VASGWRSEELVLGPRDCSVAFQMGTGGSFCRPGREADHSTPPSADVKNGGAIPSLPYTFLWRNA
jgi:hypothetical protein